MRPAQHALVPVAEAPFQTWMWQCTLYSQEASPRPSRSIIDPSCLTHYLLSAARWPSLRPCGPTRSTHLKSIRHAKFFTIRSEKAIFTSILRGNLDFATPPWPSISQPAKGGLWGRQDWGSPLRSAAECVPVHADPAQTCAAMAWSSSAHECCPSPCPSPADLVCTILSFDTKQRAGYIAFLGVNRPTAYPMPLQTWCAQSSALTLSSAPPRTRSCRCVPSQLQLTLQPGGNPERQAAGCRAKAWLSGDRPVLWGRFGQRRSAL